MATPSSAADVRGLALIAAAAASWGTTGAVTTVLVAQAGATPLVIGAVRMLIAAALLAAVARAASDQRVHGADRWRCAAAGVCNAGFQAAYFTAVTLAGIAATALVAICSAPLLISILAVLLLGERPTLRVVASLALGVAGTALIVVGSGGAGGAPQRFGAGVGLALAAGLAYALYVVVTKAAVTRTAPLPGAAWTFTAAALVMTPALLVPGVTRQIALGWPWLLYLGAVTTAGAYAAYTIGLRRVSASAAGVAALLEPLTATLLGVALFGERFGAAGWVGAALLLSGLVLVAQSPRAAPRAAALSARSVGSPRD